MAIENIQRAKRRRLLLWLLVAVLLEVCRLKNIMPYNRLIMPGKDPNSSLYV